MSRIIFLSVENQNVPTGGCKVIYRHAEALAEMGFDACVTWRRDQPKADWLQHRAPILDISSGPVPMRPTDHFVMSEVASNHFEATRSMPAARHVFVMNHFYVFRGLQQNPDYASFGISSVLALSGVIARFLENCFQLPSVPVLPAPVDVGAFPPAANKKRQIAFMPRKRAADVMLIREIFRRRFGHEHGDVAWVAIDGAGEAEVARILGESEVFLSMNHLEGLGMPPLEAMAAGCQVAGFTGGGGDDYATPENGFWIAENDHLGCAFALAEALDRAGRGDPRRAAMLAAGRATAERYDLPRMRDALRAFWGDALERRASELARL